MFYSILQDKSVNSDTFLEATSMLFTSLKPDGLVNFTTFESTTDQHIVESHTDLPMESKDPINESSLIGEDLEKPLSSKKDKKSLSTKIHLDENKECPRVKSFCCSPVRNKAYPYNTETTDANKVKCCKQLPNSITSTPVLPASNLTKPPFGFQVHKKFEDFLKSKEFQSPITLPQKKNNLLYNLTFYNIN